MSLIDDDPDPRPAWHPLFLVKWLLLGAIATQLDKLHEFAGVTVYPDPEWISCKLPFSPIYAAGGLAAYGAYALVVGFPAAPRGFLGGAQLTTAWVLRAVGEFTAAYALTAVLSGRALATTPGPFLCGAVLAIWAAPTIWRLRGTPFPLFAGLGVLIGVGFEWIAVARGAYGYGIASSPAFFGTPVPLAWLPCLYMHAAICVHRLLGGPRD